MARAKAQKVKVFIIESPSEEDLLAGRQEAGALQQVLELLGIPSVLYRCTTSEGFRLATIRATEESKKLSASVLPVLHVSCHGDKELPRLVLTNGTMGVEEFSLCTLAMNGQCKKGLVVATSVCDGAWLFDVKAGRAGAFEYFVGPTDVIDWGEALVAYSAFYYMLAQGREILDAVEAMDGAVGREFLAEEDEVGPEAKSLFWCWNQEHLADLHKKQRSKRASSRK